MQLTVRGGALALLLLAAAPAVAEERRLAVPGFDSVRIEGPVSATLATGRGTTAVATGSSRAVSQLRARVDGRTLVVTAAPDAPVALRLQTMRLLRAQLLGSAALAVDRLAADGIRLTAQGAARIDVADMRVRTLDLVATGGSRARLAGRAERATISTQGAASVDASALIAPAVVIASEGDGEVRAQAGRTAIVNALGAGRVVVAGSPTCTVRQQGGAEVRCGTPETR